MSSRHKRRRLEDLGEEGQKGAQEGQEECEDETEDSEEDSDDMDSDGNSEDKQFINKEIGIDFSAYPPIAEDFNGIKCLLSQLWLKEKVNVSELTQLLVDQQFICSVLKQEDDEEEDEEGMEIDDTDDEVYGVTSVIPMADHWDRDCIKQLRESLMAYTPKDSKMAELLGQRTDRLGLVVNERYVNLPPKISLPTYQQLLNDLKSAKADKQLAKRVNLEFDWILMVCKVLKTKTTKGSKKADNSSSAAPADEEVVYVNAEDELFDELADHRCEYSVAHQCDSDVFDWKNDEKLMEPFRRLLLLTDENWNKAIQRLAEEFK